MSLTAERRRLLINSLKWGLFALVLAAVVQQGWKLWGQVQHHEFEFRPLWFLPAAIAYLVSWLFNFWYWNVLLVGWGLKSSPAQVARAYYCGHLGKYLPGKAAVVLIRTAMLRDSGLPSIHIVASIFYETLAAIAAGAALAVALAPYVFPQKLLSAWLAGAPWLLERPWLFPVGVLISCLIGLPIITRILAMLLERLLPRSEHDVAVAEARQAPAWGFFLLMLTWWLQGLSLGFTIQSVSAEPFSLADWPAWTGATCVANVLGFVAVFAPAGLGVREGALMEILGPQIGPTAVVAAVLLRIVCLVSEVVAALALYYGGRGKPRQRVEQRQ